MILQYDVKNVSPWEDAVATYKFTYATDNKFLRPGDMKANILVTLDVCGKGVSLAAQTANLNSVLCNHFRNFFCSSYTVYNFGLDGLESRLISKGSYSMVCKEHCGQINQFFK